MNKVLYLSIALFVALLISVNQEVAVVHLDETLRLKVQDLWAPDLDNVILAITEFGASFSILASLILVLVYFGFRREAVFIRFYLSAIFGAIILFASIKYLTGRPRPESMMVIEPAMSFPSGHATMATVLAWFVYLIFKTRINGIGRHLLIVGCLIYPLLMSFTRVYLNVHYLSDVLAGMALGTCWMLFLSKFYLSYEA